VVSFSFLFHIFESPPCYYRLYANQFVGVGVLHSDKKLAANFVKTQSDGSETERGGGRTHTNTNTYTDSVRNSVAYCFSDL
jgi:hypothetical protein